MYLELTKTTRGYRAEAECWTEPGFLAFTICVSRTLEAAIEYEHDTHLVLHAQIKRENSLPTPDRNVGPLKLPEPEEADPEGARVFRVARRKRGFRVVADCVDEVELYHVLQEAIRVGRLEKLKVRYLKGTFEALSKVEKEAFSWSQENGRNLFAELPPGYLTLAERRCMRDDSGNWS